MAEYARRRMASIQLSIAAAALGVLAGIGLGRGTEPTPVEADAELAANRGITISGANIKDGSVRLNDLNKASVQKGIYFKAQTDKLFLKIRSVDSIFAKLITNQLGGYIKLLDADARFLKLDALNGFLKLSDADARFIKLGGLDGYIKLTDADARFLKVDALDGYIKLTDADARFLKLDALNGYVKLDALDGYVKLDALADYVKLEEADKRYVNGDGSVLTGSRQVGGDTELLLTVPGALKVEATAVAKRGVLTLTNLSESELQVASTAPGANGSTQGGTIAKGGTLSILIGLLVPTTVQVIPGLGDGGAVHTLNFTVYDVAGTDDVQVVGQALSGG